MRTRVVTSPAVVHFTLLSASTLDERRHRRARVGVGQRDDHQKDTVYGCPGRVEGPNLRADLCQDAIASERDRLVTDVVTGDPASGCAATTGKPSDGIPRPARWNLNE